MDLTVMQTAETIWKYSTQNMNKYRYAYAEKINGFSSHHDNTSLQKSPFNGNEKVSPPSISSADYAGNEFSISTYKIDINNSPQESTSFHDTPLNDTERLTPLSNNSTDYTSYIDSNAISAMSTFKRRRMPSETEYRSCRSDDSGIDMAPKRHQPNYYPLLTNQLKQPTAELRPAETYSTANMIVYSQSQQQNTNNNNNNAKKIKVILKPTSVGTLHLTTIGDTLAANRPLSIKSATTLSRISEDQLSNICTYHGNMVRQFPQKERSAKEQEKRNRNTIACRMSRRLKKLEQIAVEEQCKELEQQFTQQMEQKLRVNAFLAKLIEMTSIVEQFNYDDKVVAEAEPEIDVVGLDDANVVPVHGEWRYNESVGKIQWQHHTLTPPRPPAVDRSIKVRIFSVDYILGN